MQHPARRIAHLDMDAFYASVELLRRPQLRGLPLVIGGRTQPVKDGHGCERFPRLRDYSGRGVVTTATYEARAFGVRSGMAMMKAARLAPDAILLPVDFDAYRRYSRRFKEAVAAIAPTIEDRGIDEIYIDLSALEEDTVGLAGRIKRAVADATGLSCSICVAPNKLLAKLGSELDKPDGLTLLTLADLPSRVWPLPVGKVNGIGPKAAATLAGLGIETIGELARADAARLRTRFSERYTAWLQDAAHGRDTRELRLHSVSKSLSRETTFERDLHPREDRAELGGILTRLCTQLAADLERKGYAGRSIGIKLRYADFRTVTRNVTLAAPIATAAELRQAAVECLRRAPLDARLRLLGVRAAGFSPRHAPPSPGAPLQPQLPWSTHGDHADVSS